MKVTGKGLAIAALVVVVVAVLGVGGMAAYSIYGNPAKMPVIAVTGPTPTLPPPNPTAVPTVNIAIAEGWPADTKPTPGAGLAVNAYAVGLVHPRWLHVLPNGDVLVAETNAPERPQEGRGIKG